MTFPRLQALESALRRLARRIAIAAAPLRRVIGGPAGPRRERSRREITGSAAPTGGRPEEYGPESSGEEPNRIILTSHGRTATHWLAWALNRHPDFFCTHSNFGTKYAREDGNELFPARFAHLEDRIGAMSVDEYFDLHVAHTDASSYVSVHQYQLAPLLARMGRDAPRRRYRIYNLVRHPIVRAASQQRAIENAVLNLGRAHMRAHWEHIFSTAPVQALARRIAAEHAVDLSDFRNIAFFCALSMLLAEAEDLRLGFPHLPMERLVGEPQYFAWFLSRISDGRSQASPDYLATVFARGRMSSLRDEPEAVPSAVFGALPDWQRAAWRLLDRQLDLIGAYDRFGYDLAFIRSGSAQTLASPGRAAIFP